MIAIRIRLNKIPMDQETPKSKKNLGLSSLIFFVNELPSCRIVGVFFVFIEVVYLKLIRFD